MPDKDENLEEIKLLLEKVQINVNKLTEKLDDLEGNINRLKQGTALSAEDQFFFGATFAILIALIIMKPQDLESLVNGIFNNVVIAKSLEPSIRFILIIATLFASISRYVGIISKEDITKRARNFSFKIVLFGMELIVIIYLSTTITLQYWGDYTIPYSYLIPSLFLSTIFLYIEWLHEKTYSEIEAIFKEESRMTAKVASIFFAIFISGFVSITLNKNNILFPSWTSFFYFLIALIIYYKALLRFRERICKFIDNIIRSMI
jgi:hypothetical protein